MLQDGLYFDLPESDYFAADALGSSDMVRLHGNPSEYWFRSRHNQFRAEEEVSDAKRRGTATHCLVLYGEYEFLRRYAPYPDGPHILKTDADVSRWLTERGATKLPRLKSEKVALALSMDPSVPIADAIVERLKADGVEVLPARDFYVAKRAGETIRRHQHLAPYLQGGRSEVSVFWTDRGVRKRARFDYLKPDTIVDLKTIANTRGIDFRNACRNQIGQYNYPIQAAHYWQAREHLAAFIQDGQVFGDSDPAWLAKVAKTKDWSWVWLFYQTTGSPSAEGFAIDPRSEDSMALLDLGIEYCRRATEAYKTHRMIFGLDTPWVVERPVEPLGLSSMPTWWRPEL